MTLSKTLVDRFSAHFPAAVSCPPVSCPPQEELKAEDGLIGFFQNFRPDGSGLHSLFEKMPSGEQTHTANRLLDRLELLFRFAGDPERPEGGRDAYFIVRNPEPIQPQRVEQLGEQWLGNLHQLALQAGATELRDRLAPIPSIRVLEGIAPKHPRNDSEKAELLMQLRDTGPNLTSRFDHDDSSIRTLQGAYYYIACDWMLRDYLMWPLFEDKIRLGDTFEPYFQLWRHGIKYRIFSDERAELYMPRH
ncbi:apolipoprotein acyltransferase [Novipirellula aureliae]|nr:apolipoprotein acyltransferase [Novipirellula aureliae]